MTPEEIANLTYDPSANDAAFREGDYETEYAKHGLRAVWWEAFHAIEGATGPSGEVRQRNGLIYVKHAIDDARCMFYRTKKDILSEEFGLIQAGATGISVIPGRNSINLELARNDRVASPDVTWLKRSILKRSAEDVTQLVWRPVTAIETVYKLQQGASIKVDPVNYTFTDSGIQFTSNIVEVGDYFSVAYRYMPVFTWLQVSDMGVVQRTSDDTPLPQRGVVTQVQMTDYEQF